MLAEIKFLKENDLKVLQKCILIYLNSDEGVIYNTEKEISRELECSSVAISYLINSEEMRNLVGWNLYCDVSKKKIKKEYKKDFREKHWYLTDLGTEYAEKFKKVLQELMVLSSEKLRKN